MTKIIELINSLPDLLSLKPATEAEIAEAENQLGLIFSDEYKLYLKNFGAIMADGIELSGIAKSAHRNVVELTKQERKLNPNISADMYVIENTGIDGIMIWQNSNGTIYKSTPNAKPVKIAPSLHTYLMTLKID